MSARAWKLARNYALFVAVALVAWMVLAAVLGR